MIDEFENRKPGGQRKRARRLFEVRYLTGEALREQRECRQRIQRCRSVEFVPSRPFRRGE